MQILTFFSSKITTRWYYQYWWTCSSILKVLEIMSFQYLHSILKKKLGMEFIFCTQINIKVFTSWQYHFWWKWPDMFKVPKIGSWQYLCNILRKIIAIVLCSKTFCDTKHLDILHVSGHVCYLRCFCFLWLAMEFKSFTVLRNSKYIKQTDQNNCSCFFLLILIKTEANKAAIFVF